jgi:hypothetical protein
MADAWGRWKTATGWYDKNLSSNPKDDSDASDIELGSEDSWSDDDVESNACVECMRCHRMMMRDEIQFVWHSYERESPYDCLCKHCFAKRIQKKTTKIKQ